MRILVTGGAGFIGSHLVDAFLDDGHDVAVLDNFSTGLDDNVRSEARLFRTDIRDAGAVDAAFADFRPDVLCHQAAQLDVRRSVSDPAYDADVNIVGTLRLFQAGLRNDLTKVIFASSGGAIYGEPEVTPTSEEHPIAPISPYGVAKYAAERYLHYYQVVYGLPYVALRYANVYGPRQNPHGEAGVISIFAERMLRGMQPLINGDGCNTRDYVYVRDVVEANRLSLREDAAGPYNVGTGIETDVNGIFRRLNQLTGANMAETHAEERKGEQRRSCLDYSKIERVLGWSPRMGLDDGLARTVAFFIDRIGRGARG